MYGLMIWLMCNFVVGLIILAVLSNSIITVPAQGQPESTLDKDNAPSFFIASKILPQVSLILLLHC